MIYANPGWLRDALYMVFDYYYFEVDLTKQHLAFPLEEAAFTWRGDPFGAEDPPLFGFRGPVLFDGASCGGYCRPGRRARSAIGDGE